MGTKKVLPRDILKLVNSGILRRVGEDEFSIDGLSHRRRIWLGWCQVTYSLSMEVNDEGERVFEIVEDIRESGDDVLVSTTDSDEIVCWITENLKEMEL